MSQLLQASPEEMRRICRMCPNVLGRDTAQISNNIDILAEKMRVPKVGADKVDFCYHAKIASSPLAACGSESIPVTHRLQS